VGFVFGLATAGFFATSSILVRIGQRHRTGDDGVFMTVLVNVLTLGVVALFADPPPWNTAGVLGLVVGGVIGTVGGRSFNLRAVRLIGPSRANAFMTTTPVVAAIAGWIVLDESLGPVEALGGVLAILGLLWLVRGRAAQSAGSGEPSAPIAHYLVAAAAPTFFGLAFVARKFGLERYPSSMVGALIGASAAFLVLVSIDAARGRLGDRVAMNLHSIPWWFVGAGVATSAALLSQFTAFTYLPAWVVGILQGTQGIWTIGLSWVFLRGDERIDRTLVGSVLLVAAGVALIGLAR
jgi:drug/metabolite transporter (DMT)-like permease